YLPLDMAVSDSYLKSLRRDSDSGNQLGGGGRSLDAAQRGQRPGLKLERLAPAAQRGADERNVPPGIDRDQRIGRGRSGRDRQLPGRERLDEARFRAPPAQGTGQREGVAPVLFARAGQEPRNERLSPDTRARRQRKS